MSKKILLTAVAALGLLGAIALQAQPNVFDTIEKMKMSWDLTYKLKPGDSVKYEIDTISSQKVNAFNVAEAGSEESSDTGTTTRVYLTQKVTDVDDQKVTSLEFTYDNVVIKASNAGREEVLDTSGMAGLRYTVRVSAKGKVIDVEGSGDTSDFKKTIESLFLVFPDKTLKIGDEWEEKHEDTIVGESGIQIASTTNVKYLVKDFEEYQRRDAVVLTVTQTIDQQLHVRADDPGGTVTSTEGQGTGKGTGKGTIRVDAKTGQIISVELQIKIRNSMTVDEEQLVGATTRTKVSTEFSSTTNTRLM